MNTNRFVQGMPITSRYQGMPIHPPDPKIFLYTDASHYGCVCGGGGGGGGGGGSSRTDESILSWSLVGRPITVPYQHVRNNGYLLRTDNSLEIHSSFLS